MYTTFQCADCAHLFFDQIHKPGKPSYICKAFPNGVPKAIVFAEHDHQKPYNGDNGIQYQKASPEELKRRFG